MAAKCRKQPIRKFAIPSGGHTLTTRDWESREPLWYGVAEVDDYSHPAGGVYKRCRVEVFADLEEAVGYIPLPLRYQQGWAQLCYSVVYWLSQWKAWVAELARGSRYARQPPNFVRDCMHNAGARLLKYLTVRRLVVEELLQHKMSKDEDDELLVFDEYLIRDRFDWLWLDFKDVPERDQGYLGLDPVHPTNEAVFTWENQKLLVPKEMIPPEPSPGQAWVRGKIDHFDFQKTFNDSFPDVLKFYCSARMRARAGHTPYSAAARGLPRRWHERHEPAIRFLTEDEDRLFGQPPGVLRAAVLPRVKEPERAGTSGPADPPRSEGAPAARPSEPVAGRGGIVDDPETRQVVAALAQSSGGISLPEAHECLRKILGDEYNEKLWGQLFDDVVSAPGEEPARSVEDAFKFYGTDGGEEDSHAKSMENYRKRNRTLL
ncbi:hypothetical protein HD554DRAFT_2172538 [Boletus coccyginus]|nr:hypothetical protein HD554DRAFT_2172538 [Boletus coccyginus]